MTSITRRRLTRSVVCSVRTPRLLLRAWRVGDAPELREAILASRVHLQRWLDPSRNYPEPLEKMQSELGRFRRRALAGEMIFGIFSPTEHEIIGAVGAHPRIGQGASEIGYWVHVAHLRKGYASEAAAALVKINFQLHGVRRIEIHTDPTNAASCAVARRLGFNHQTTIPACVLSAEGRIRDDAIFCMLRGSYADTPAATLDLKAFDRAGDRIFPAD